MNNVVSVASTRKLDTRIRALMTIAISAGTAALLPFSNSLAAENDALIEEILVIGSHIRVPAQQNLAAPVQSVTSADIESWGAKDIPDIIRNLTINTGSEYQVSGLNQPQTAGTSNFNLRGLGLSSTLVLINGHRQTLSAIAKQDDGSSFVDTNSLVPKIMIRRLDILKDGAAAIYGTDAVAGVVNFVTWKDFEGARFEIDYQTDTNDGSYDEATISALFGGATGQTNYVLAVSFFDRDLLEAGDRDWADGTALSSLAQPGGFLTSDGFMADPDCGVNGTFTRFGGAFCGMDITPFFDLFPEEERTSLAANISHAFNDSLSGYLEFAYANNEGATRATPSYPILRDFPVIPTSDPNNPFAEEVMFFGRILGPEGSATILPFDYETWRLAGELDGQLNNGWFWDVSANYSRNEADVGNADTVISRLKAGLAGAGGANGDAFYSPFGSANNASGLIEYLLEESSQQGEASLTTLELLFTGGLFTLPAGEVGAAAGYQYRDEELEVDLDDILNANDFYTLPGGDDFSASRDVHALFVELSLPLHRALELQLALRYEDYGDDINSLDPKIAALWQPGDGISVRGSFGTSFRAPSLLQTTGRLGANDVVNDSANSLNGLFRPINTAGNPDLDPEEADVFNLGITVTSLANLELSLDYWRFDYTDLIVKESAQGLVDQAIADFNNGLTDSNALNKVQRVGGSGFGFITLINSDFINASSVETSGVDLGLRYHWDTSSGQFELRYEWTLVSTYDLEVSPATPEVDGAGSLNATNFARPVPEWRSNLSLGWNYNAASAHIFARYIDSYTDDAAGNADIRSHTTVDLTYSYSFEGWGSETSLTLGAVNIFDRDPPGVTTFIGFDVQTHDPRGRLLYVKLQHSL